MINCASPEFLATAGRRGVVQNVNLHAHIDRSDVRDASSNLGACLRLQEIGHGDGGQDGDDRDHDQQFDQRKPFSVERKT